MSICEAGVYIQGRLVTRSSFVNRWVELADKVWMAGDQAGRNEQALSCQTVTDADCCVKFPCVFWTKFWHKPTEQVTITLLGDEGNSEPHHLSDPQKSVFERGAVDLFLLTTPFPLGDLQAIRLWHNNSGSHPEWYSKPKCFQKWWNVSRLIRNYFYRWSCCAFLNVVNTEHIVSTRCLGWQLSWPDMFTCSSFKEKTTLFNAFFSDNVLVILPHEVFCNLNNVGQSFPLYSPGMLAMSWCRIYRQSRNGTFCATRGWP